MELLKSGPLSMLLQGPRLSLRKTSVRQKVNWQPVEWIHKEKEILPRV